jgi:hypothetical protein
MARAYDAYRERYADRARMALDAIDMKPTKGIPSWLVHVMDMPFMEQVTGHAPGDYVKNPDQVYIAFQKLAGCCYIDQYLADNPLTMASHGFAFDVAKTSADGTGRHIVLDGIAIDSPEAVLEHMERVVSPRRAARIASLKPDDPAVVDMLIAQERGIQDKLGADILKGPYSDGFQSFPIFHNYTYGYENYFMAYALYPEIMEQDFAQQADLAVLENRAAANAIDKGGLPRLIRLDYDFADSRSTLVNIKSLDAIWFPHFRRAIEPFLKAGIRLIWHCDGNLMQMVPRLLEAGIGGFQGFQYEDGMDYERICRMTDRNGDPLFILAGVSVTRTLPFGTPEDVRREFKWLVQHGPKVGFMLGGSSSIVPGTRHDNIMTLIEGLHYYQQHGRGG